MSTVKPAGITGAIVIVIVLAAWEALNSLGGIAGSNALDGFQDILASRLPSGDAAEMRARLSQIQSAMTAAVKPEQVYALAALTLPVAVWAIIAALRLNKGKPNSARWFARAATALVVVEVVQLIYAVQVNRTLQPLMTALIRAGIPPATSLPTNVDPAEISRTIQTFLQIITVTSTVLALAFAAGKIFVCLYARRCALKPEVVAWTAVSGLSERCSVWRDGA